MSPCPGWLLRERFRPLFCGPSRGSEPGLWDPRRPSLLRDRVGAKLRSGGWYRMDCDFWPMDPVPRLPVGCGPTGRQTEVPTHRERPGGDMTGPKHQAPKRGVFLAPVLMIAFALGQTGILGAQAAPPVDSPGPPSSDGVQPMIADTQSSNDDCGQLGFDHGISIASNGQVSGGDLTVTVTDYNSPTGYVDWSSNLPIHGVYAKGGPSGGNLFNYPAGDTGDHDLHTPQKPDGGYYAVEPSRLLLERRRGRARRVDHQGERTRGSGPERRLDHVHAHGHERRNRHRDAGGGHRRAPRGGHVRLRHRGMRRGRGSRHLRAGRHRRRCRPWASTSRSPSTRSSAARSSTRRMSRRRTRRAGRPRTTTRTTSATPSSAPSPLRPIFR